MLVALQHIQGLRAAMHSKPPETRLGDSLLIEMLRGFEIAVLFVEERLGQVEKREIGSNFMRPHVGEGLLAICVVLRVNVQNPDLEEARVLEIERAVSELLQAPLHDPNRGSRVSGVVFLHPFNVSAVKLKRSLPTKSRAPRDHFPNNRQCSARTH